MRRLLLAALIVVSGCAPKVVPMPVVTAPKYPDFIQPTVPPAFQASAAATGQSRGWAFLQSGDIKTAEREFSDALKVDPTFYPAEAALGNVELARKDAKGAVAHFDRALELHPQHADVSALVGRGQALLALNREADALAAFQAALVADPTQTDLAQRIDVLKFRNVEKGLARARDAARAGRFDESVQAYSTAIASSPDSAFLYRELAGVERQRGNIQAALDDFRRALSLDPADARSAAQIGELLDESGQLPEAEKAYVDALAIERSADVEKRLEDLRDRVALSRLPAEYRAIDEAPQVTRADLAALIGIRLAPLLQAGRRSGDVALITDVRTNWAATWIMAVTRAGIMDPFANHAFQPHAPVRRIDLAQAVARLLARVAAQNPSKASDWASARLKFSDLSSGHVAYPAASVAVASGVMKTSGDNAFEPSKVVTGAEAVEAIGSIEALAGRR